MITGGNQHRERMGWIFLLAGFTFFLVIAVSVPVAFIAYLQNSMRPLPTLVQANQGTVRIDDFSGVMRATSAGGPPEEVGIGAEILTDASAQALVSVRPRESESLLARVQVYGNTSMRLDRIDTPRFAVSDSEQRFEATLERGRIRLTIAESEERPFGVQLAVPQGILKISGPGQYSLEVDNSTAQVAVQSGSAEISTEEESLALVSDQRAVISITDGLIGPLDTERNLVRNGNFRDFFEQWSLFAWNVELGSQPEGQTNILPIRGEPTLQIVRTGEGHADVRLRQALNRDVADYESLQLFLTFRIVSQNLSVCGFRGSECPLFLRMNYIDVGGIRHSWQQGFYAVGDVNAAASPDACVSCDVVQSTHLAVPLGQDYFFEVDLKAELARQGYLAPRFIENLSLVSSGHSFAVEVVDVALMAKE